MNGLFSGCMGLCVRTRQEARVTRLQQLLYGVCCMCFHLQDPGSTAVNKHALFAVPLSLSVSE